MALVFTSYSQGAFSRPPQWREHGNDGDFEQGFSRVFGEIFRQKNLAARRSPLATRFAPQL
jgi:hypothetical protein